MICGKPLDNKDFQKVPHIPRTGNFHEGDPLYWANKSFYPELEHDLIFCSPQHSLQFYQKLFDKRLEVK